MSGRGKAKRAAAIVAATNWRQRGQNVKSAPGAGLTEKQIDWDPSGLRMSEVDLPARLERYGAEATVERAALSRHDVRHGGLPHFMAETKAKDPRYEWYARRYGRKCWELDALSPVLLRQRVEEEVVSRLDLDAWNRAVEVEKAERDSMQDILARWPGSISVPASKYGGAA